MYIIKGFCRISWAMSNTGHESTQRLRIFSQCHCRRLAVSFRLSLTQGWWCREGPLAKNQPEASLRAVNQLWCLCQTTVVWPWIVFARGDGRERLSALYGISAAAGPRLLWETQVTGQLVSECSSRWSCLPRNLRTQVGHPCLRRAKTQFPASRSLIFDQEFVDSWFWFCFLSCCSLTLFCTLALPTS